MAKNQKTSVVKETVVKSRVENDLLIKKAILNVADTTNAAMDRVESLFEDKKVKILQQIDDLNLKIESKELEYNTKLEELEFAYQNQQNDLTLLLQNKQNSITEELTKIERQHTLDKQEKEHTYNLEVANLKQQIEANKIDLIKINAEKLKLFVTDKVVYDKTIADYQIQIQNCKSTISDLNNEISRMKTDFTKSLKSEIELAVMKVENEKNVIEAENKMLKNQILSLEKIIADTNSKSIVVNK